MTPIKRLTNQFKAFNTLTQDRVSRIHFNRAKPKDIPYPYQPKGKTKTKGVLADAMIVYYTDTESIAFSFNYDAGYGDLVQITYKKEEVEHLVLISYQIFKEYLIQVTSDIDDKTDIIYLLKDRALALKEKDLYPVLEKKCSMDLQKLTKHRLHDLAQKVKRKSKEYPRFVVHRTFVKLFAHLSHYDKEYVLSYIV